MLSSIAAALGNDHDGHEILQASADAHGKVGLESAIASDYAGSHWLGTFALYLLDPPPRHGSQDPGAT